MKKILAFLIVAMVIFVYACQPKTDVMQKPLETQQPAESTGDATTDSFGNDLSSVSSDDKELDSSGFEDMDSGFNDVENI